MHLFESRQLGQAKHTHTHQKKTQKKNKTLVPDALLITWDHLNVTTPNYCQWRLNGVGSLRSPILANYDPWRIVNDVKSQRRQIGKLQSKTHRRWRKISKASDCQTAVRDASSVTWVQLDVILANKSPKTSTAAVNDLIPGWDSCAVLVAVVTLPRGVPPKGGSESQWCPVVPDELALHCCILSPDVNVLPQQARIWNDQWEALSRGSGEVWFIWVHTALKFKSAE